MGRPREGNPQRERVGEGPEYNEWSQLHHSSGLFCAWIGRDRSVTGGGPGEVSRGLGPGEPWAWSGGHLGVERTQCLKQRDGRGRCCFRLPSGSLWGKKDW